MPILNLNTDTARSRNARKDAKPVNGEIFLAGLASHQHTVNGYGGTSYNSPFTSSDVPPFPKGPLIGTLPQIPALQTEGQGKVVTHNDFTKVQPHEKGATFVTNKPLVRAVVRRTGGPSTHHDTAKNPNSPVLRIVNRPTRKPFVDESNNPPRLSFLRSGGTLSSNKHVDSYTSRWSTVKRGAAE